MALSRVKSWVSGEVLTASDLNAEFNNLLNNARSLISPLTGSLDMDGNEFILDGDADTSITADTDDRIDLRLGGVDVFIFDGTTASTVNGLTFTGVITGARPRLSATGSDTNIGIALRPKGTGAGASVVLEDGSGNEIIIGDVATASAVNELTATNAATGNRPRLAASGGDTNVGLALRPKGTSTGASVVIEDGNGNEVLIGGLATASAVNEVTVTNAATGNAPTLAASGGDTNIDLKLTGKGTGVVVDATGPIMPVGSVIPYAGTSEPTGWLFCYGQAISRSTYARLFTAISTTYGVGDGSTTFNLPDLRGRVVAGKDDMGGASANRLTDQSGGLNGDTLGDTGGSETHTLTEAEMPAHTHSNVRQASSDGLGGNSISASTTPSTSSGVTASAGSDTAHNNVQPTIILNYIIKT